MEDIKKVPIKNRVLIPVYESADGLGKIRTENQTEHAAAKYRQSAIAQTYNELTKDNRISTLGIWELARTLNSFNVNAQRALDPFMKLKGDDHVLFFDIEAIGTPEHMRSNKGLDLFAMTELAFSGTNFNGKDFVNKKGAIVSMAVAPEKDVYARLKQQINKLKQNPMMSVSQDMHRTLLDLAKYTDASKFKSATSNGKSYMSLLGHSRVPSIDTAFTRNTIEEIERGLNNLFYKGTKLEDALSIFQGHIMSSNAKLGGYNIHHYDLPAILGIVKDTSTKKFFNDAAKNSLDFFHGYSATVKNPYSLTGASLRQEHIYQALLAKRKIKAGKEAIDGNPPLFLYHLAKDDIQANIDIAGFTHQKIKSFIKGAEESPTYDFSSSAIKKNTLELGQELFSYQSSSFDKDKHKYNLVGKLGKDGKSIVPRWGNLNTSLPSNENFVIREFLKDVALTGTDKKGFGLRLDSKDVKGKILLLISETQEGLAQQIHSSFMPMDDAISRNLRDLKVKHDASFREYERMFDNNGWEKMKEYYNYLEKAGSVEEDFDWRSYIIKNGGTEELAMKFPYMVARLEGERDVWGTAISTLKASGLSDKQKSIALRQIKSKLDEKGDNKAQVTAKGNRFFNFNFDKEYNTIFNAKETNSIKDSFRSYINDRRGDRIGNLEKSYKLARIDELQELIINNFKLSPDRKASNDVKYLVNQMKKEVMSGNKTEIALNEMSNLVREKVENMGTDNFVREVTNQMTDSRVTAIKGLMKNLPNVMRESIENARSFRSANEILNGNSPLKKYLKEQDNRIKKLFEKKFGTHGMNDLDIISRTSGMAAKYEELVDKIMSAYSKYFNTQIRFMDGGNPLLILASKKSIMNLSEVRTYEELVRNPRVFTIELPSFDKDMKVKYGGNRKTSVIRSGIGAKGAYHSTSVTDALNMILDYSKKAKELSEIAESIDSKNAFVQIRQGLRYRVERQVDPVSTDASRKFYFDDKGTFDIKSAMSDEVRSSKWDITGYAESWYRANSNRLGFSISADIIAQNAIEKGITFFEAMGQRAKGYAIAGELLNFAKGASGLKGSMVGINTRSASKGFIATTNTDARTYRALGNYYAHTVENPNEPINYRKVDQEVASRVLRNSGKDQSFRTKNSFISSPAFKALDDVNEVRGITMQTGYMTNEEITLKLNDANTIMKYKCMIDTAQSKKQITPVEASQMKGSLDKCMISTSEGLAFMDYKLMKAFDGMDEVRINMNAEKVMFNNSIEIAIEKEAEKQGLAKGLWKEKGITFDKPLEIDINSMFNEKNHLTLGKYEINNIKNEIVDESRFKKGDTVSIIGFDTDDINKRSLVLGRQRKTGHGFKVVTEGGFRATMTPMLGDIMSDLYGVEGVEQVISYQVEKKEATDLPALIRGYDTQIRQQFSGSVTNDKITTDYANEERALSSFYKDVEQMLGIKTTNKDGQYVVDSNFGLDGKQLDYKGRKKLSSKWMDKLGLNREVFADITMAHEAWNRQGGINRDKVTVKGIGILDNSDIRTGLYVPGESSIYANFIHELVYSSQTKPEIKAQQKVFNKMVKFVSNYENDWEPKTGDVVIDYTSDGTGLMTDVNAQMKDGVLHISKDSFEERPRKFGHNQNFTVEDYGKTVINAGLMEFNLGSGVKGKKIQEHLLSTKGTAYLKLPEFAANQYIPLLDINSMKLPGNVNYVEKTEFLDTLKGNYTSIVRKTEEYNDLFTIDKFSASDMATRRGVLETEINREVSHLVANLSNSTSKEGVVERISGNFSRDNLAVFFPHYGINEEKQRNAVMNDITRLHVSDKANNKLAGDVITASEAFFSENSAENLTLGNLYGAKAYEKIRESLKGTGVNNDWGTVKNGEHGIGKAEQEKSILASATSSTISSVNNTRMRMSTAFMMMAETKKEPFNETEGSSQNAEEVMDNRRAVGPEIFLNEAVPIHHTMRNEMNESLSDIATVGKKAFSGSAISLTGDGPIGFGELWATNALMKGTPTPEGLQEMAPVAPKTLGSPTARITPNQNGEYINISVKASASKRMNHNNLAAMINNEIMAMSNVKMNTSVNVNDNSKKIDSKWLESAIANAMNKGYAY
ncbi:TPA: hypothetical protein QCX75_001175 [Bacillus mycoides]|uniref:hypothetical protein n=1 Tax=Bacillus sp. FSL P2-0099 TaxID=2921572 RepID=UPI0030F4DD7A|nr:hypothetical protein [Bacillus mycoides]